MTGIEVCLRLGADVIVNNGADNPYCGEDIPSLAEPVLANVAEIVVGAQPIDRTEHFSWVKKMLQRLGSRAVRLASKTDVADARSGFCAMSREAAVRRNVFHQYTCTPETIIQTGQSNLRVVSVSVRTNADRRPSRLVKSISGHVRRSLLTIRRVFVTYRPLALLAWTGSAFLLAGVAIGARCLIDYFGSGGSGHIQSLILASLCVTVGTLLHMMGLIADLIASNRMLLERVDVRIQSLTLDTRAPDRRRNDRG